MTIKTLTLNKKNSTYYERLALNHAVNAKISVPFKNKIYARIKTPVQFSGYIEGISYPYNVIFWKNSDVSPSMVIESLLTDTKITLTYRQIEKIDNSLSSPDGKKAINTPKITFSTKEERFIFYKNNDLEINFPDNKHLSFESLFEKLAITTGIIIQKIDNGYQIHTDFGVYFFTHSFKRIGDNIFTDGCIVSKNNETSTLKEHTSGPIYEALKSMTSEITLIRKNLKMVEKLGGLKPNSQCNTNARDKAALNLGAEGCKFIRISTHEEKLKVLEDKYQKLLDYFNGQRPNVSFTDFIEEIIIFYNLSKTARERYGYGSVYDGPCYALYKYISGGSHALTAADVSRVIHAGKRELIRFKYFYTTAYELEDLNK